ncbi:MAG: hypothetical protein AAF543_16945 [Pseudomonadota bacterium]
MREQQGRSRSEESDEILLELTPVGTLLRVAAFHPETLVEVTFQAPLMTDRATLLALAKRKLAFVLGRQRERR